MTTKRSFPDYDERLFRSTDGGQTWADLGEVMPEGPFAFAVPDAQTIVAADYGAGIGMVGAGVLLAPQMSFEKAYETILTW